MLAHIPQAAWQGLLYKILPSPCRPTSISPTCPPQLLHWHLQMKLCWLVSLAAALMDFCCESRMQLRLQLHQQQLPHLLTHRPRPSHLKARRWLLPALQQGSPASAVCDGKTLCSCSAAFEPRTVHRSLLAV